MTKVKLYQIAMTSVFVFILYLFWGKYAYQENNIILYSSAIIGILCMTIDVLITHEDVLRFIPTGVMIHIIMCIYSIVTGFIVAKDTNVLISELKTYIAFSLMCVVICYVSNYEKRIDWLINILIIIDTIVCLSILFNGYYHPGYGYVLGKDHNPNTLSVCMDIGLFCIIYKNKVLNAKSIKYIFLAGLFLYIIVGCGSRKGLLAAAIMCTIGLFQVLSYISKNIKGQKRFLLIALVALVVLSAIMYYSSVYSSSDSYQRMQTLGDESEGSSRSRLLFYQFSLDYFFEHPIFGIGFGQFAVWNPYKTYAHSTYAEAFADWGTIGSIVFFVPFLVALVKSSRKMYYVRNSENILVFGLIIMEVFLGFGQIWFYSAGHMISWTLIFLLLQKEYNEDMIDYHINTRSKYKYVKD